MITSITIVLAFVLGGAALLVDRSRSETARLRLLIELSERLQLSPTIQNAAETVPSFATRLFPRLEGAIFVNDATADVVRLASEWNNACEEMTIGPRACYALLLGHPYISSPDGNPPCEHTRRNADATTICVPMLEAGESFGLLVLRAPASDPLPSDIEQLAKPFAHQIALALSNLRLQETLRAAAVRDSLTGLYNRRCITESLTLELLGGGNPRARVGVIIIDVDHFKHFNDTWGHGGGDALLQRLATLMLNVFDGPDDIVCRYGGEEFVVVLPNVSPERLRARAEVLVDRVRSLTVDCNGHMVGGITVSAGIAISPGHANDIEGLIAAADRALYTAKSAGRDRVSAPPPQIVERIVAA